MSAEHALFEKYPITGEIALPSGAQPTPYHVYDGRALFITGLAKADAVEKACMDQDVYPVLAPNGGAAMGIFVCRFDDASHGPHLELHAGVLASPTKGQKLPSDAHEAFLTSMATEKDWGFLSLHLWNDTRSVVSYNSDYLGLDAYLCAGAVELSQKKLSFRFYEAGQPLVQGQVRHQKAPQFGSIWRMIRLMGLRGFLAAGRQKWSSTYVINRKSKVIDQNKYAQTCVAADEMAVMTFDAAKDSLEFGGPLANYDFKPQPMQHLAPFRFVYLHPDDTARNDHQGT